jgi:hypothetical protein
MSLTDCRLTPTPAIFVATVKLPTTVHGRIHALSVERRQVVSVQPLTVNTHREVSWGYMRSVGYEENLRSRSSIYVRCMLL